MHIKTLNHNTFTEAFQVVAQLLRQYEPIWRTHPFIDDDIAWRSSYPNLYQSLLNLSDAQLASLESEDKLQQFLADYLPGLRQLNQWRVSANEAPVLPMEKFADLGIGGRKVTQICGFASVVGQALEYLHKAESPPCILQDAHIIDWCAGKGHLAKQLHYCSKLPVTCLEYSEQLCHQGHNSAQKLNYPITFIHHDVLTTLPRESNNQHAILYSALHACGDLHLAMLHTAIQNNIKHIAWSPCCYHLTHKKQYEPLSAQGQQFDFNLTPTVLRLAVSQLVTGGQRIKRLRQQELLWRIGFDLLHRSLTGINQYRPMRSIPKQWLSGTFEAYCQHAAQTIDLSLPSSLPTAHLLQQAAKKLRRIARLEKAKLGFRQALEYYLVLDQILFTTEKGYDLTVKTFCQPSVTPRNIMINAAKTA